MVLDDALHNGHYANQPSIKKWRQHWPHSFNVDSGRYGTGLEANYCLKGSPKWGNGTQQYKGLSNPEGRHRRG